MDCPGAKEGVGETFIVRLIGVNDALTATAETAG